MNRLKSITAATVLSLLLSGCSADGFKTFTGESPANTDQQAKTAELSPTDKLYQQVFEQLDNGDLSEIDFLLSEIISTAGDSPEAYRAHVLRSMLYAAEGEAYYSMLGYLDKGIAKAPPNEEEKQNVYGIYSQIQAEFYEEQAPLVESIRFVMEHEEPEAEFSFIFQEKTPNTAKSVFAEYAEGGRRIPDAIMFETFVLQQRDELFSHAAGQNFQKKKLYLAEYLYRASYALRPEHQDLAIQMLNKVIELEETSTYMWLKTRAQDRLAEWQKAKASANPL